jgi:hypothetical protein
MVGMFMGDPDGIDVGEGWWAGRADQSPPIVEDFAEKPGITEDGLVLALDKDARMPDEADFHHFTSFRESIPSQKIFALHYASGFIYMNVLPPTHSNAYIIVYNQTFMPLFVIHSLPLSMLLLPKTLLSFPWLRLRLAPYSE